MLQDLHALAHTDADASEIGVRRRKWFSPDRHSVIVGLIFSNRLKINLTSENQHTLPMQNSSKFSKRLFQAFIISIAIHSAWILTVFFGSQKKDKNGFVTLTTPIEITPETRLNRQNSHPSSFSKKTKLKEDTPIEREKKITSNEGSSDSSGTRTDLSSNQSSTLLNDYLATLFQFINTQKDYPKSALFRKEQGRVLIALTIDSNGVISELSVIEPSPFEALNQSALDTTKKIGKLPPLPPGITPPLRVKIPILFEIREP